MPRKRSSTRTRQHSRRPPAAGGKGRKGGTARTWGADFDRWKAGTPLAQIAREHSVRRRVVKMAFRELAGGREAFAKLRASGAGCQVAFNGKRAKPLVKGEAPVMDDSKVRHVSHQARVDGKWGHRYELVKGKRVLVMIDPKGVEYVQARPIEKADVIFDYKKDGWDYGALGVLRYRILAVSSTGKKMRKEQRLVQKGEKLLKHRSKIRKARKQQRKQQRLTLTGGR